MRRILPPLLIVALAFIVTGAWSTVLYRRTIATHEQQERAKAAEAAERKNSGHSLGNPAAKVTVEEYGDFQCPPCGLLAEPLNQMVHDFEPNVRLIYRNHPLPVHQHAREAAVAAEAAGRQGKFWEMHDLIYREQAVWSKAENVQALWLAYATKLGLDPKQFALDLISEQTNELVEKDEKEAQKLGVKNTPTIFLNDQAVNAKDIAPDSLRASIKALLEKQPASTPQAKKK